VREVEGEMWEREDDLVRRVIAQWSHLVQCRQCGGPIDSDLTCEKCGARSMLAHPEDVTDIESELEFWTVGAFTHIDG
jgi:hypothetical protein